MKKYTMDIVIALAVLLAMSGSAYAQSTVGVAPTPDSCTTSLLLAGVVGGLGFARRFMR